MANCIGVKKDGRLCDHKAKPDSLYCGVHDPNKKRKATSRKTVDKVKLREKFDKLAQKVKYVPTQEDIEHKLLSKLNRVGLMSQMPAMVNKTMAKAVQKYALASFDYVSLLGGKAVAFPRKIWMIISWHLSSDIQTYHNVAITCKKLYDVFVKQKVFWYYHPLKGKLKSPKIYTFPIYTVLEFMIPEDLNDILKGNNLPSVEDVLEQFKMDTGAPKSEFEASQRKGDILLELSRTLIKQEMEADVEFEEEITGGGIFSNATTIKKVKFNDDNIKSKCVKLGKTLYVIIVPIPGLSTSALERHINKHLYNFTGVSVVQLMRV